MNAFSRSWQLTKLTFDVINKDKELLWFALLSFIFSTAFAVAMVVPTMIGQDIDPGNPTVFQIVIIFITYFGLAFIATFFNVCVVYTTKVRFEGDNATFGESISFAFPKIGLIVQWSLLSASVGLLLRLLQSLASRLGKAGQIIARIVIGLIGLAWSVATIFVVPVLVYEGLGPVDAVKKSVEVLKRTWGESLIRSFGLGLIQFFIFLGIIGLSAGLTFLLAAVYPVTGVLIGIGVGVMLLLLMALVFGVATTIFNTALYIYANNGKVAAGFDEDTVKNAFQFKQY